MGLLSTSEQKPGKVPAAQVLEEGEPGDTGPAGPAGPAGPQGPKGDRGPRGKAPRVNVACRLVKRRTAVRCKVTSRGRKSARMATTVRLAGSRKTATRKGRRSVTVTLKANRRLSRATRVRVQVRTPGSARTALTVRAR